MLDGFDEFLQRIALLWVYDQEIWILPLAVAIIIYTKGRPWAVPLRRTILLLLLVYVVAYEMDRYSLLAVPMLALAIASDAVRDFWYRLLGGPEWTKLLRRMSNSTTEVPLNTGQRRRLRYSLISWGVQLAVVLTAFVYFSAPPELWAVAGAAALIPMALALTGGWRYPAEWRFRHELSRDPRLSRYLTWVRWTRARKAVDRLSMLADNWIFKERDIADPHGFKLWLARWLVRQRRMMTIESTFVCQNLLRERALAWRHFQTLLHGGSAESRQAGAATVAPISEVLASEEGEASRLRWLAMTEALAECLAFSDESGHQESAERPFWLGASELLAHAGEVEYEIALDLSREMRGASAEVRKGLEALVEKHRSCAARYFDLSARCVENYLKRGSGVSARSLSERWREAVGDRLNLWQPPSGLEAAAAEDAIWGTVLALRYQLLGTLAGQADGLPKVRHMVALSCSGFGNEPSAGLLAAALARDSAESSLWIAMQQGDPGSRWVFDDQRIWADRLKQADYWRARLLRDKQSGDLQDVLAEAAIRRVLHLWGLAIEQDIDVLRPGTDIWRDRLETAADLFVYEGSLRVRQLAGLLQNEMRTKRPLDQIVEFV